MTTCTFWRNVEREGRLWGEFEAGENRLAPAEAQVVALMNINQPSWVKISAPTPATHPLGVGRAVAEMIAFSGSRTSTLPRTHAPAAGWRRAAHAGSR
jgi:hypothetical protein